MKTYSKYRRVYFQKQWITFVYGRGDPRGRPGARLLALLRRANQEEGAPWTNTRIRPGWKLVALHIPDSLYQFFVQLLFFFLFQCNLEGLARAHIVEMQFDGLRRVMLARGARVKQFAGGWVDFIFATAEASLDEFHRLAWMCRRFNAVNRHLDGFSGDLDRIFGAQLPVRIAAFHQFAPQQFRHLVTMLFIHRRKGPDMPFVTMPAARIQFARLLFGWKMRLTAFVLLRCSDLLLQLIQCLACNSPEELVGGGFAAEVVNRA